MSKDEKPAGPDFTRGVLASDIKEGAMLLGHVGDKPVLLARSDGALYAIGAECSHYHGPLAEGLLAEGKVHCPWHHACFDLRTGEALAAPAIDPVACWLVEEKGGKAFVRQEKEAVASAGHPRQQAKRVVIVGGGAAGFATAELLRREGFEGEVTLLSADADPPYDRPNCSKDYLAGQAPKNWMPLRDEAFYKDANIDLRLKTEVAGFDPKSRTVVLADGVTLAYDILVLATGAEPQRPAIEGLEGADVHTLRSLDDAEAIIAAAAKAKRVAIIGASFIGLEVAASLKQRGLDVHVVAPEPVPLEKVMGAEIGAWVQKVHEKKGVVFHLGREVTGFSGGTLHLDKGKLADIDFVVLGVGVKPRTELAEAAGLKVDNGVVTDDHLRTSADGVYAAGDIARYPDPVSGKPIRVEHWVHAERQGQYLARLIMGEDGPFHDPPYFWSSHYDKMISYTGHAKGSDPHKVAGSVKKEDAAIRFQEGGRLVAVATIGRDLDNLKAEQTLEHGGR
ncbi:pyridine nucleotide-disulfide oxidoreductase [Labrys miyagiensis]|uniref:Pyridine nucleotide-disulfide oxidoreductase n=1 Tax=Labrys miyagiensis TaxID=346912 RepID=A0ABQ6CAJ7_9HYPH|nr:FAD-dependent oxidoreductase [Labrys miyagiensis]GLS17311.1 pyridine nucleotide-disulfide oxidoreductase [Labrys miyagiensis]